MMSILTWFILKTVGEDRWLCTLLIKESFQILYCAAADCKTYCPTGFSEFFNQRRRWIVSTMANILDLISSSWQTSKKNRNYSWFFAFYQVGLFPWVWQYRLYMILGSLHKNTISLVSYDLIDPIGKSVNATHTLSPSFRSPVYL